METKLNVTKGVTTLSPQIGFGEGIMQAQVWDSTGKSMILIEPTDDPAVATNIAILCSDALNTHNTTGYTPSQLLEQNRELVEAATKLAEIQRWVQDNTQRGCENLSALENLEAVLLKHSKDV